MNSDAFASPEASPYWRQYAWIGNELGLTREKAVVFALVYERDCTDSRDAGRITTRYIAEAVEAAGLEPKQGDSKPRGIAGVFRVLNDLSAKGLVTADMDDEGLSMRFRCDAVEVAAAIRDARREREAECSAEPDMTIDGEQHGQ